MLARVDADARREPSSAASTGALARALHAWEQWESAHQAYLRAQALAPDAFEWHYLDAVVLQRLARHEAAAARLTQALAVKPGYLPARVRLAEARLDAGQLQESRPLFEALTLEPATEPAAHVGLGRIAALEGQHTAAIGHFERAVAIFPELGSAYYALARSYRALGRADDAQRALDAHRRFGPRWPAQEDEALTTVTSLRDDPRAILARGVASVDAGDVAGAIAAHEAALQRDPTLVNAHANLVSLYGRTGDWSKVGEHYRAALEAGFNTADLQYDYGVALGLQNQWDAAADAYRGAIAINPLHAKARNNLGQILERSGELDAALAEYGRAVEAQPSLRIARFNHGRMLLARNRLAAATSEFEKLQQPVDAETPRYVFALATAHVRGGRREEGLRLATEARRLALELGQSELAAAIARELEKLK